MILLFELTNNSTYMPDIRIERKKTNYKKLLLPVSLMILLVVLFFCIKEGRFFYDSSVIGSDAMKEDIAYYFNEIKRINPQVDRFYSYAYIDSVENELIRKCRKKMPYTQFVFELMQTKYLFDEHTGCYFDSFEFDRVTNGESYSRNEYLLPIVKIVDRKLYWRDVEVELINGQNVKDHLTKLRNMVGLTLNPKHRDMLMSYYFSFYLVNTYGIQSCYKMVTKDSSVVICDTLKTYEEYNYDYKTDYNLYGSGINSFRHFSADGISVFYFNKCSMSQETLRLIDKEFKFIIDNNIKYLFIDISNNSGGDDSVCLYILDNYLAHDKFKLTIEQIFKPASFYSLLKSKNLESLFPHSLDSTSNKINKRIINLVAEPNSNGFKGDLIVLQGINTFSAAILFSKLVRFADLGVCVGQGVAHEHNFAGNIVFFALPNSKIRFSCATTLQTDGEEKFDFDKFITPEFIKERVDARNIDSLKTILHSLQNLSLVK